MRNALLLYFAICSLSSIVASLTIRDEHTFGTGRFKSRPVYKAFVDTGELGQLQRLEQAFEDALEMVTFVANLPIKNPTMHAKLSPLIHQYFPENAARFRSRSEHLLDSLMKRIMSVSKSTTRGSHLDSILVYSLKHKDRHPTNAIASRAFTEKCEKVPGTIAHVETKVGQRIESMAFCDIAYSAPDFISFVCPKKEKNAIVDYKMFTLASVVIQAMSYTQLVWGTVFADQPVIDQTVVNSHGTVQLASGPLLTRELVKAAGDKSRTLVNGNSIAWYITEMYWSAKCGTPMKPPTSNNQFPPDPECLDKKKKKKKNCEVM